MTLIYEKLFSRENFIEISARARHEIVTNDHYFTVY